MDGQKPRGARQLGLLEQRPGGQRGLVVAGRALVKIAGFHQAVAVAAAGRATEARGPAGLEQGVGALRLRAVLPHEIHEAEAFLELHLVLAHGIFSRQFNMLD